MFIQTNNYESRRCYDFNWEISLYENNPKRGLTEMGEANLGLVCIVNEMENYWALSQMVI